ncbi:antitoxin VbhA family protein [Odoribacter lunatus]|uniref:antitoxin VbhA family protein n=1 Tax=Odoribacter lunatus TaxID=2941335 RepID=UPI00203ECE37|nr:antitoxin VbhA family protein [Odoribacter lunatus]
MNYNEKYQELMALSHSENIEIKRLADNWLISIGLQEANGFKVSPFLLDLAIKNIKGELTHNEVNLLIDKRYADSKERNFGSGDGYEIVPADSPKIKEIEEFNRKLRPELYAQLDKK